MLLHNWPFHTQRSVTSHVSQPWSEVPLSPPERKRFVMFWRGYFRIITSLKECKIKITKVLTIECSDLGKSALFIKPKISPFPWLPTSSSRRRNTSGPGTCCAQLVFCTCEIRGCLGLGRGVPECHDWVL